MYRVIYNVQGGRPDWQITTEKEEFDTLEEALVFIELERDHFVRPGETKIEVITDVFYPFKLESFKSSLTSKQKRLEELEVDHRGIPLNIVFTREEIEDIGKQIKEEKQRREEFLKKYAKKGK